MTTSSSSGVALVPRRTRIEGLNVFVWSQGDFPVIRMKIPEDIHEKVMSRDGRRCCFTGVELDEDNIATSWIVPPIICFVVLSEDPLQKHYAYISFGGAGFGVDRCKEIVVPENCLTMHKKFLRAFQENIMSFDFKDDYKIVHFINMPVDLGL
ncbi:hypothetical protein H0H81_002753 [Sphagnurus paluster]|uniref:Uncharacterized protein n=1 Tax=Sphagnurus paluster TaxID=117069 RepID=A0A9P7GPD2_9AGAR|nr:hypothetical protein H0H81_002753 [Sphagnurus paluster]